MELYNKLRNESKFFLIAGPCVIESEDIMKHTAEILKTVTTEFGIQLIFKSSYKKANRTSLDSPVGVGIDYGLKILEKIKNEFEIPILTDVHETIEVDQVAAVADVIQIPAFLSRQTELLIKAGESKKIVNIKKGQFMAPGNIQLAAEKVSSAGNYNILLTERGTSFGYHELVVDFRSFADMKSIGFPVVFDVTHSLQKPSVGKTSGGSPEYAEMMARAALATKRVDGLFIETHPHPAEALSDSSSMLPVSQIKKLLQSCLNV